MSEQILVTRSSMPTMEEYIEEIRPIWESHWLTNMGEKHEAFQLELQKYMGVPNVELLTNGHMALELSLQAMNLQGEVITTPFTFASTTHAIVRNGLEPVFCDIDPETYTMDVTRIERLVTDRTCAILPVHVYGNICNMEEIERIAHKYELKVCTMPPIPSARPTRAAASAILGMHPVSVSTPQRCSIPSRVVRSAIATRRWAAACMS